MLIEAKFGDLAEENQKLREKNLENADRIMELEQGQTEHFDSHAPKDISIQKVLKHLSDPRENPLDGKEAEWHQELHNKSGKDFPGAVWVPLQTKAGIDWGAASPTSGASNLVPTQTLDLIDVLRQQSTVLQQGVTTIPAEGQISIPRKLTDSTAYWISGDSEDITLSNPTFEALSLSPKFVGGLVLISLRMMTQTGNEIERIIRQDLMGMIAEEVDLKALQGDGTSDTPTGVLNASGIGSLTWGGASSPLDYSPTRFWFNDAADMEENLVNSKAYTGNLSFLCDAATYKTARYSQDINDADQFAIDPVAKTLLGLRSHQRPTCQQIRHCWEIGRISSLRPMVELP